MKRFRRFFLKIVCGQDEIKGTRIVLIRVSFLFRPTHCLPAYCFSNKISPKYFRGITDVWSKALPTARMKVCSVGGWQSPGCSTGLDRHSPRGIRVYADDEHVYLLAGLLFSVFLWAFQIHQPGKSHCGTEEQKCRYVQSSVRFFSGVPYAAGQSGWRRFVFFLVRGFPVSTGTRQ